MHLLIARGADPSVRDDAGITPLIAVTKHANVEAAKALIAAGADANATHKDRNTALDRAREELDNNRDTYFVEEAQQLVQILEQLDNVTDHNPTLKETILTDEFEQRQVEASQRRPHQFQLLISRVTGQVPLSTYRRCYILRF